MAMMLSLVSHHLSLVISLVFGRRTRVTSRRTRRDVAVPWVRTGRQSHFLVPETTRSLPFPVGSGPIRAWSYGLAYGPGEAGGKVARVFSSGNGKR